MKYNKEERSYYVNYIGNNAGKKCFLKYHINNNYGYPITDFDVTILLDKFNVEDLIKIYIGILMEYKIILVFDNYSDINNIILSIISLIYPLDWNFPFISFITTSLLETLEAPFGIIIGLHSKYLQTLTNKLKQKAITEETIIYNITSKSFLLIPDNFPEFPLKIVNELRSNIYLILSEKLAITSDVNNNEIELSKIFSNRISKEIDHIPYLNLKFIQVFFNVFIEIIKNIEQCISYNKIKAFSKINERFQISDIFDSNKFIMNREYNKDKKYMTFIEQFSKTLMFTEFLEKYIRVSDKKNKYKFIKKYLNVFKCEDKAKNIIKELNKDYIKNKLITYYNVLFLFIT
jgi:hypothetical protein